MRSRLSFLFLIFLVIGCATVAREKAYIQACLEDPVCYEEAYKKAEGVKDKAEDLAALSPVPAASPIAGSIAGYLALIIFLRMGGKKKVVNNG